MTGQPPSASPPRTRLERERRRGIEGVDVPDEDRWNNHIHYHRVVLDAVPATASRILDVGCGEGLLTRQLAASGAQVVGLDRDAPSLELARRHATGANVAYVLGDLMSPPFAEETFDAVTCVMALHHVNMTEGVRRLGLLVRPGGVLAVIGIAKTRPRDLPYDAVGTVLTRILRRRRGNWVQPAPMCWPPPVTYKDVSRIATDELPGATYQRRVLFRYTLLWTKPEQNEQNPR